MTGVSPGRVSDSRFSDGIDVRLLWDPDDGRVSVARDFLVGDACTIADISNYAYTHVAGDAGYELDSYPSVSAWLALIADEPGFVHDLSPTQRMRSRGRGRSIYG